MTTIPQALDPDAEILTDLPMERPATVLGPVQDQGDAELVLEHLARIHGAREALKDGYQQWLRRLDAEEREILRRIGAYHRRRTDGDGTELHYGTLQDWAATEAARNQRGQYVDTHFGRLAFRKAAESVKVTDVAAFRTWCANTGNVHLCPLRPHPMKRETLAHLRKTQGEIPDGIERLEAGRYQTFCLPFKSKTIRPLGPELPEGEPHEQE